MRRRFAAGIIAAAVLTVAGCTAGPELRLQDRWRKDAVREGTSKEGLLRVMGTEHAVIYNADGAVRKVVPNPYEMRDFTRGGRTYEVIVYFTNPERKNGPLAEEEFTPFVLENGRVIGKGRDFLRKIETATPVAGPDGG